MFDEIKKVSLGNGETLAYREAGDPKCQTLVLIHGNMSSSFHFNTTFPKLDKKYQLLAPDMRGFGESTYHEPVNKLKDFADDILDWLDQLAIKDAVVLGWSTGGGVAMEMAIARPDVVSKMILVESVGIKGYPMFRKDDQGQPVIGDFLSTKEEIAADPVQVLPILGAIEAKNKEVYRAVWNMLIYNVNQPEHDIYELYLDDMLTQRNLVDVDYSLVHFNLSDQHNGVIQGKGQVAKIKIPVLIIQGERDLVVPKEFGDGIYAALKDNATYATGDWGHSPFVDCLDDLVKKIIDFA